MAIKILGDALKGFDFAPWGGIEGFLEASRASSGGDYAFLKRSLSELARAVDMTAVAISGMPFDFKKVGTGQAPEYASDYWNGLENGDVYDASEDWKNLIGGIENPQRLIYLLASSLCGGAAYLIPTRTPRMIFSLQYAAPRSVEPYISMNGLEYFDRTTQQGRVERYKPSGLIYFWLPDSDVEIGPAENNPLANALLDAQLMLNMKNTMRVYGERGFVPITLLGAKGMPDEQERQKAENYFDRLLKGGFNVLAKIFNSEALSIIRVGAGMDELKQSFIEIKRDAKEGIADAFGIPTALFMSDNAFASEFDALRKQWYTTSRFVGIYQTIEEVMSDQLLNAYGLKMQFDPERMEIFQEDEAQRADSLNTFVTAVTTNPRVAKLGMGILGYDLTQTQDDEMNELAGYVPEDEQGEEPTPEPAPAEAPTEDDPPVDYEVMRSLSADDLKDLALWCDKAKAWHKQGKGRAVDWENKHLPEEIAAPIRLKLAAATNEAEITRAFELVSNTWTAVPNYTVDNSAELKTLAQAIEKAVNGERAEKSQQNINITMPPVNTTIPERQVTVNVPEQKAPQVNVTVDPPPVKVDNVVNVPEQKPPDVKVDNVINVPKADNKPDESADVVKTIRKLSKDGKK